MRELQAMGGPAPAQQAPPAAPHVQPAPAAQLALAAGPFVTTGSLLGVSRERWGLGWDACIQQPDTPPAGLAPLPQGLQQASAATALPHAGPVHDMHGMSRAACCALSK